MENSITWSAGAHPTPADEALVALLRECEPQDLGPEGERSAPAALNLDYRTYVATPQEPLDGEGEWHVQQTTVDNYSEWIAVEDQDHMFTRRPKGKSNRVSSECADVSILEEEIESIDERIEKNEIAARRAKRNLKWKVLMLRGDRIWTLTTRGGIPTFADSWKLWGQFERYCSRRFIGFKCVVVMERHKSGAFHIHFVTNKFFDVSSMRLWWHRILTGRPLRSILTGDESPGNIQVSKALKTRKLGSYLAKYLGKTFEGLYAYRVKRFASSKGIGDPHRVRSRMHALCGEHVYRLRRRAECAGWRVEAVFEGQIAGRRLIWLQCVKRARGSEPPEGASIRSQRMLASGANAAYS